MARPLLVVIFHVLRWREPYVELGDQYYEEREKEYLVGRLVRKLERLGHPVTLATPELAAAA